MKNLTPHQSRHIKPVLLLELAGWPYKYHSGAVVPNVISAPYTAVGGITAASPTSQSLDVLTGIAQAGSVTVQLAYSRAGEMDQLLTAGPQEAENHARLAVTIPLAATVATITVDRELSDAPVGGGVIWVGQEAFLYSSRTAVAPWTFTITSRGWYDSEIKKHTVDDEQGWAPYVTANCWSWGKRKARLRVSQLEGDGTYAHWVDEISGYLSGTPRLSSSGSSIAITITPITAMLRRKIGGAGLFTGLEQEVHAFDGEVGHRVNLGLQWDPGAFWTHEFAGAAGGATAISMDTGAHADLFDITLPVGDFRQGRINIGGSFYDVTSYAGTVTANITPALSAAVPAGFQIFGVGGYSFRSVDIVTPGAETAVDWPVALQRAFAGVYGTTSNKGVAGRAASIAVEISPDGSAQMELQVNSHSQATPLTLIIMRPSQTYMYFAFSLADPEENAQPYTPLPRLPESRWGGHAYREVNITKDNLSGMKTVIPLPSIASAWWQSGEKYIWVEKDVFGTPSMANPIMLEVRCVSRTGEVYRTQPSIVNKQLAAGVFPGRPGYLLTVAEGDRWNRYSFGDFQGQTRVSVRQVLGGEGVRPTEFMLRILMSTDGSGFNGAYDVFNGGLGLTTSEVNVDSFTRFPLPGGAAQEWDFILDKEKTVEAFLSPVLYALQAAIVPALDLSDGRRKLTLVKLALPARTEATRTRGVWELRAGLGGGLDERIVNSLSVKADFDRGTGKHLATLLITDQDSIDANGRTVGGSIDLGGVHLSGGGVDEQRAALIPIVSGQFALRSMPRRVYRGECPWSEAVDLDVGSVVLVDAPRAPVPGSAVRGIDQALMRVTSIQRSVLEQKASLELVWYGYAATGWSPALLVVSVVSATTVGVAANAYTSGVNPLTGGAQVDLDFFEVGDVLRTRPRGDMGAAVGGLTVTFVDTALSRITFSAPHGVVLPRGATIVPENLPLVSSYLAHFCFLSDGTGKFASGAAGFQYA